MKAKPFLINLGVEAQDIITKTKGIVVARAEHLTGCNTYGLASQVLADGKRVETDWFDEGRLKQIGEGISHELVESADPGSDTNRDNPRI